MDRLYIQDKMPLNLICSSSSWNTWTSNSPTIYETVFTNGADKESNMGLWAHLSVPDVN